MSGTLAFDIYLCANGLAGLIISPLSKGMTIPLKGRSLIELMSQLMRLWYLPHSCRRPAKAQPSLRVRAVSPEPSLFAYKKYGGRRRAQRAQQKIRHLAPLKNEFTENKKYHNLVTLLVWLFSDLEMTAEMITGIFYSGLNTWCRLWQWVWFYD